MPKGNGQGRRVMDTPTALEQLGIGPDSLTQDQRRQLDRDGYFIFQDAFTEAQCARMADEVDRIVRAEGDKAGSEVSIERGAIRVSNVFNKSDAFDSLLQLKPLLAASYYLLGDMKVHGANMREPQLGTGRQPLHSDSVKHGDGRWCIVNALITFDPMTLDNGPTRVVPGSHIWAPLNVPGENAADYTATPRSQPHEWAVEGDNVADHVAASPVVGDASRAPADPFAPFPGEVLVTVPARAVVVCNAHMWHSGTAKQTDMRRRQLHLSYTRRDLPQQLVQRAYLTPALYARMSPAQRYLLDID
jgi:ectoine hydroxylase-related dioxygenase (phytanoyl-CoA dioxygenase family)